MSADNASPLDTVLAQVGEELELPDDVWVSLLDSAFDESLPSDDTTVPVMDDDPVIPTDEAIDEINDVLGDDVARGAGTSAEEAQADGDPAGETPAGDDHQVDVDVDLGDQGLGEYEVDIADHHVHIDLGDADDSFGIDF